MPDTDLDAGERRENRRGPAGDVVVKMPGSHMADHGSSPGTDDLKITAVRVHACPES